MKQEKQEPQRSPWIIILFVLFFLTCFSFFVIAVLTFLFTDNVLAGGNVAVIPIKGVIMIDEDSSLFSSSGIASSTEIVEQIQLAQEDPTIEAIILDINSPGGAPVASAEITRAIKEANKTTVAVIREVGASGAYWAASAADHIIANEVSITGSIGVLASYIEYSGLMERYNVSYERFVAGKYKDMGTPYREMSEEEKQLYQNELDLMHDIFIRAVAENRDLEYAYVKELATGQIYLGVTALELGLIDKLGSIQEAYTYIEETKGIEVEPVAFETEKSFWEELASALDQSAFHVGTGIGAVLVQDEESGMRV